MWDHENVYAGRFEEDEQLLRRVLSRKLQKYGRRGRLEVKINIMFNEDNSLTRCS
jgi:hypothetical protein